MPVVQTQRSPFAPQPISGGSVPVRPAMPPAETTPALNDRLSLPRSGKIPGHVPLPWQFEALPARDQLSDQARRLKPAEAQALLRQLPSLLSTKGSLPYPDADDSRSPHRIVQTALALAMKDKVIDVAEASELRGLLLTQLPVASERARYARVIDQAPLTPEAAPILRAIDADLGAQKKVFTPAEIALIDSTPFKLVFPNFMRLELAQQRRVIEELSVYLRHFPSLLEDLNSIKNTHYGPGFQFFFLEPEENQAFDKVIPKGVVGVVMPGSEVVKDPMLRLLADKISLQQLDRGGMFIDTLDHGVFTHEFAHVVHLNLLNDDQRDQIKRLYSQAWQKTHGNVNGFVSEYAKTNPYEYFADSMKYYLCGGAGRLKSRDPQMYAFVAGLLAPGAIHRGFDGGLLSDPEQVHLVVGRQGGHALAGVSVSRESDLFSVRHFEGGSTQELALLAGPDGAVARASVGLKAAWKPTDQPAGVYVTGGASLQAGALKGVSVGAGGYAGVGVDYKGLNLEARQTWMTGQNVGNGAEIRAGWRFEF